MKLRALSRRELDRIRCTLEKKKGDAGFGNVQTMNTLWEILCQARYCGSALELKGLGKEGLRELILVLEAYNLQTNNIPSWDEGLYEICEKLKKMFWRKYKLKLY